MQYASLLLKYILMHINNHTGHCSLVIDRLRNGNYSNNELLFFINTGDYHDHDP